MKSGFVTFVSSALALGNVWAGSAPLYINNFPVNAPPDPVPMIDARAWVNQSVFSVQNDFADLNPVPYRSQNTLRFTNIVGATMFGVPGFEFVLDRSGRQYPMDTWVNNGTISADSSLTAVGIILVSGGSETSLLSVRATNILNTGPLSVGAKGVVHLEGTQKAKVSRSGLRAGPAPPSAFAGVGFFLGSSNYINDFGVQDLYWGLGNNNVLRGNGDPMVLNPFFLPCPNAPIHEVYIPTYPFTNTVFLPLFNACNYAAAVYTNQVNASNRIIQVVFYPTNFTDTNFNMTVQFQSKPRGPVRAVVGFHNTEFDIVWRSNVTYSVYLVDNLAFETNVFLAANTTAGTRRPSTYSIARGGPDSFTGFDGDTNYTPSLLYDPLTYRTNEVNIFYTAYSAFVNGYILPSPAFTLNDIIQSTNYLGRVDVLGDQVNLNRTRVRGESAVVVKAPNLINNQFAEVDAPFVNFEVGSLKSGLSVSNLAPATVRRINGSISCWSATWENFQDVSPITNRIRFHVLVVDHSLSGRMPVTTDRFAGQAGNLEISDPLRIGRYFQTDSSNLTFTASGGVTLPPGQSVGATNLRSVLNFTNEGIISVPGEAHFGDDRYDSNGLAQPYLNFVNRGSITSATMFAKSSELINSGTLGANQGVLSLDALRTRLLGSGVSAVVTNTVTNYCIFGFCYPFPIFGATTNVITTLETNTSAAQLVAGSVVEVHARNLWASNSLILAGRLVMGVTNKLDAGDLGAPSTWLTAGGVDMLRRPTNSSSLMGVTLVSQPSVPFQPVRHTWSAKNLGATRSGFSNNLAVGRLVLDGTENSVFQFYGTRSNKALYVDYFELLNYATNFFGGDQAVRIDPSITVYFANANIAPEKLTNSFQGRLQWVGNFTGPLSSTNIVNFCTNADSSVTPCSYVMNVALANSKDIDSDGDGLVNAEDPDPLNRCPCAQPAGLVAARASYAGSAGEAARSTGILPPPTGVGRLLIAPERRAARSQVVLSWESVAGASNVVEFTRALSLTNWQVLTNFPTGPIARRLTASDELSSRGQRFYRVRVLPPSP